MKNATLSTVFAAAALAAPAAFCSDARASLFITTGMQGAQVQVDREHTQHWTYSVSQNVTDLSGGLFTMKRGSQTTDTITFSLYEGTFADFSTATMLLSVTLGADSFSQGFTPVAFQASPVTLLAGRTYTGVLYSNAVDAQNRAYFIKGGGEAQLYFSDGDGNPTDPGGDVTPPGIPAPGALALLASAGLVGSRRRR